MPEKDAANDTANAAERGARDGAGARGRRGRPALDPEAREALILDALERVMAEDGLQGASMAAVARMAGMSKRTLYAVYGGRDALFEAWVARIRAALVRPLPDDLPGLPLEERLRLLLGREARAGASRRRVMALRAVIAEAPRNPRLARAFRRAGPEAAHAIVAEELSRAAAAGELAIEDPAVAAKLLCDMAWPNLVELLLDPASAPPSPEALNTRVALAIRVFLHGAARATAPQGDAPAPRRGGA